MRRGGRTAVWLKNQRLIDGEGLLVNMEAEKVKYGKAESERRKTDAEEVVKRDAKRCELGKQTVLNRRMKLLATPGRPLRGMCSRTPGTNRTQSIIGDLLTQHWDNFPNGLILWTNFRMQLRIAACGRGGSLSDGSRRCPFEESCQVRLTSKTRRPRTREHDSARSRKRV
jgi:hypothetical protein